MDPPLVLSSPDLGLLNMFSLSVSRVLEIQLLSPKVRLLGLMSCAAFSVIISLYLIISHLKYFRLKAPQKTTSITYVSLVSPDLSK